ncbi:MAG: hypothetical protein WAK40_02675 [Thermoplasmata archaeon]
MKDSKEEESGRRSHYGPWVWTAYRAYNELLREKVKTRFEAQEGPWMEKVADVLVEIVNARWEGGKKRAKGLDPLFAKLDRLLSE